MFDQEPVLPKSPSQYEAEVAQRVLRRWHEAVPNDRMAHLVKDATRALLRALQVRLAAHNVQLGHWTFLRILWERDGVTQRELSEDAGVMEPTTAVALRAMEALGYITRQRLQDNRKNIYVFLTPQGKALKRKLVPLAEQVNALALQGLGARDIDATRRCLLRMLDNLARDDALTEAALDNGR